MRVCVQAPKSCAAEVCWIESQTMWPGMIRTANIFIFLSWQGGGRRLAD